VWEFMHGGWKQMIIAEWWKPRCIVGPVRFSIAIQLARLIQRHHPSDSSLQSNALLFIALIIILIIMVTLGLHFCRGQTAPSRFYPTKHMSRLCASDLDLSDFADITESQLTILCFSKFLNYRDHTLATFLPDKVDSYYNLRPRHQKGIA